MVQLLDCDIRTREVLDWKGVHVLHFIGSSCSQKLRVFLNLKGIPWESKEQLDATRRAQEQAGKTLEAVAGF